MNLFVATGSDCYPASLMPLNDDLLLSKLIYLETLQSDINFPFSINHLYLQILDLFVLVDALVGESSFFISLFLFFPIYTGNNVLIYSRSFPLFSIWIALEIEESFGLYSICYWICCYEARKSLVINLYSISLFYSSSSKFVWLRISFDVNNAPYFTASGSVRSLLAKI